jgi:hypothetical protein
LRRIAGTGDSPVVTYEGNGTYFIDRLADGVWRLEVYPDAIIVQDPFSQHLNYQTVASRLVSRAWPMKIQLDDLGGSFSVAGLNTGNHLQTRAEQAQFTVSPGVYLLSKSAEVDRAALPAKVGQVGLTEFVCPAAPVLPPQLLPEIPATYPLDQPLILAMEVVTPETSVSAALHWRAKGQTDFSTLVLTREHGYHYSAVLPANALSPAGMECYLTANVGVNVTRLPNDGAPLLTARAAAPADALVLFDGAADAASLVYTRIGDTVRHGVFKTMPASGDDPAALRLMFPLSVDRTLDDYTASLVVKKRVAERGTDVGRAKSIVVKARASAGPQSIFVTLVEADGTSWSKRVTLSSAWADIAIPLADLVIAQGVKLPLGYPERWNYWLTPAKGRGGPIDHLNPLALERVQISFRPESNLTVKAPGASDVSADVASITLDWK